MRQDFAGGHDHGMGCLLALFAGMFPRVALIMFWIARPERVDDIFTTVLWPILGIVFMPFTTLIYVLLYVPRIGVTGSDWWWVALAAFLDICHWGVTAGQGRASRAPA